MTITNKYFKIAYNNLLTTSNTNVSSELSGFEFSNAVDNNRSTQWITEGQFVIGSTNNKIYINDGSDKTATLTSGSYTRSELATEVQTQLNAVSSNWVCVDNQLGVYQFGISNSGSVTLRFSVSTNAAWETLGYTETSNQTGTNFVANEVRIHTSESLTVDFGEDYTCGFYAMIGPIDEEFALSVNASITIEANTINDFTSPPFSVTATRSNGGAFAVWDEVSYRYWRVVIEDKKNPNGGELNFSTVYLGSYLEFNNRNIQTGFTEAHTDNSTPFQAQSGFLYFSQFPTNSQVGGATINQIDSDQKLELVNWYRLVGIREPFFFVTDPALCNSSSLDELTYYVRNAGPISFQHIKADRWSASLQFNEVI